MAKRGGSAHVATIKTKGKDGAVYTSQLLRRSYREGGKVRHENLGNLSHLPPEIIDVIRAMLAGRRLVVLDEDFEIERSLPHGHVAAVLGVLRDLDLEPLLARDRCRERDLVVAMIVQRLIAQARSCQRPGALRRPHWAMSCRSARSRRPSCWRRWTGWLSASRGSSGRSRAATSLATGTPTRSCSTTCPRATWRVAVARWRDWATRAMV